jgi:hypothetical protein
MLSHHLFRQLHCECVSLSTELEVCVQVVAKFYDYVLFLRFVIFVYSHCNCKLVYEIFNKLLKKIGFEVIS